MSLSFEWNDEKAASNLTKHGVSFELAARVFLDMERMERHDGRDDYGGEDRFITVGLVGDVELTVAYTMRGDTIRLISARRSERHEQDEYWKNR
jgi:uncharacterized protein